MPVARDAGRQKGVVGYLFNAGPEQFLVSAGGL
jgi:hypothetical protein